MPLHKETQKLILNDIKNKSGHLGLPVTDLTAEDYTDWTGEPAVRVQVILDEGVNEEKVSGEAVGDLKSAIRESLRKHGIAEFAYIFVAKRSELAETDEE